MDRRPQLLEAPPAPVTVAGACTLLLLGLLAGPAAAATPKHLAATSHGPTPATASTPGLYRVRSSPHLEVEASNLMLTAVARDRLERIAERYLKATNRRLVVTGGTRTPQRQAELMVEKLQHGEDILALYDHEPALEVRAAYREGVAKHQGKPKLVRAVRETIEEQIRRGIYISRHLLAGAADVRSRGMTPARVMAFRAAVAAEPGVTIIDERDATEPHLHLSLL
jgi:hypothetical protein